MIYMNEYEVEKARARYGAHPVLGPATLTLENLVGRSSRRWAGEDAYLRRYTEVKGARHETIPDS